MSFLVVLSHEELGEEVLFELSEILHEWDFLDELKVGIGLNVHKVL